MNYFKPKSVLFYGVTIGSVILLFRVVSQYGEKNLEAPPNLNGRYMTEMPFPGCPSSTRLVLTIQQSGIYLSGVLQVEQAETLRRSPAAETPNAAEQHPLLFGEWQDQQILLSGSAPDLSTCTSVTAAAPISLSGEMNSVANPTLSGQIRFQSNTWTFTAPREAMTPESTTAH